MCLFEQLEAFLAPQEIRLIELSSEKFKSTGEEAARNVLIYSGSPLMHDSIVIVADTK